ncbi:unnamed protein product [Sympodiomycopsis kandeliae]
MEQSPGSIGIQVPVSPNLSGAGVCEAFLADVEEGPTPRPQSVSFQQILSPLSDNSPSFAASDFATRPWLVSQILGNSLQTTASSMPLLVRSTQICDLIKSGAAGVNERNLLSEARQGLQSALSEALPNHYDVLTSMLALTEVWNLSDLSRSSSSILKVDPRSTQAMVRLVELRLSTASSFAIPVNVTESALVYWSICSVDAFDALDADHLPLIHDEVFETLQHHFRPLNGESGLEMWFLALGNLAAIVRDIAKAAWSARTTSGRFAAVVQRRLLHRLSDWREPEPSFKPRDDYLRLLHLSAFAYLQEKAEGMSCPGDLESIAQRRQIQAASLQAMAQVFGLVKQIGQPSFLDQSRAASHVALSFAGWALSHVEQHFLGSSPAEIDALLDGARCIADVVSTHLDREADAEVAERLRAVNHRLSQMTHLDSHFLAIVGDSAGTAFM